MSLFLDAAREYVRKLP